MSLSREKNNNDTNIALTLRQLSKLGSKAVEILFAFFLYQIITNGASKVLKDYGIDNTPVNVALHIMVLGIVGYNLRADLVEAPNLPNSTSSQTKTEGQKESRTTNFSLFGADGEMPASNESKTTSSEPRKNK